MQKESFEKIGNFLFKYRGQLPLVLIVSSIPFVISDTSIRKTEPFIENIFYILSFLFILSGHFIRFIAIGYKSLHSSGKNRDQQVADKLNTKGIYSIVRHPLYLANLLIWLGLSLILKNLLFFSLTCMFFSLIYWFIIYAEESFLKEKFQLEHQQWAKKTPAFFPNGFSYEKVNTFFNWKMVWKNEYPGICATFSCIWFIKVIKYYWISKSLFLPLPLILFALFILIFGIGSKWLKHKTDFFPKVG